MAIWESGRESGLLDDIIAGRKTIEGRLNRDKFARYQPGDRVWLRRDYRDDAGTLQNGEQKQAIVEVVAIRKYASSLEMVTAEGYERVMPDASSPTDAAAGYDKYYSSEDQAKYGVLAIEFAVIPRNRWDDSYDADFDYKQMKDSVVEEYVKLATAAPQMRALDIGCGTGRMTRQLKSTGCIVTGIDPSQRAVAKAMSQDPEIDYRVGGIETVEGEVFHVITCKLVYAFIEDKVEFLNRVHASLASGGVFILITPTLDRDIFNKPKICVDRSQLLDEVSVDFVIESQRELPLGLCLALRPKSR